MAYGTVQLPLPVPVQCLCPNHQGHFTLQGGAWIWRQNALCSVCGGSCSRVSVAYFYHRKVPNNSLVIPTDGYVINLQILTGFSRSKQPYTCRCYIVLWSGSSPSDFYDYQANTLVGLYTCYLGWDRRSYACDKSLITLYLICVYLRIMLVSHELSKPFITYMYMCGLHSFFSFFRPLTVYYFLLSFRFSSFLCFAICPRLITSFFLRSFFLFSHLSFFLVSFFVSLFLSFLNSFYLCSFLSSFLAFFLLFLFLHSFLSRTRSQTRCHSFLLQLFY